MAKNQRLDATITIGSVLQKSVGKNLNVIRSGLDSVGDEIKRVTDRQRELSKQRQVLEKQGRSVDELDREYEQLGRTLDDLRRKQERYERAARAANRVGQNFSNMNREIGRVARTAGIAIGAASAAVFGLASSTAAAGDEFAKQARALGFNVEAYQELQFAAERSGVSASTFNSSMTAFTKRLGEAAQGSGAAKDALEQLGLSAQDLVDMEPDVALGLIADRMKGIKSPADRAAIAADLFSRAGVRMTNMLGEGSDGIFALREEARRLGLVLDEDTTKASETYQDSLLGAQSAVRGLKNTIGGALIPVVTEAMDSFTDFMASNQTEVRAFADTVATKLGEALPHIIEVASGIGTVAGEIGGAITQLADFVGGWENFGVIVGGVLMSRPILSIFGFVRSVFRLGRAMTALAAPSVLPVVAKGIKKIGAAMTANPIGATISVIALGAGLIIDNWEKIEPKMRPILDALGAAFTWVWENVISPVIDGLMNAGDGIVAAWREIKTGIGTVLDWMGAKFDWVMEKLQPLLDGLTWLRDKGAGAVNAVGDFFSGNSEPVTRTDADGNERVVGPGGGIVGRAIGGAFGSSRPLLVGERGPELMYPSQGGFIAHNRALERMAGLADRAQSMAGQVAQQAANVTQNITINAMGMSVEQLVDELERRKREAQQGALFDGASGYGQYGGAYG